MLSRDIICLLFSVFACCFLSMFLCEATPAYANTAAMRQPDLWIRKIYDTAYVGDNIINTTGAGQMRGTYANPFRQGQFIFRVQNNGTTADSFRIVASRAPTGWVTKYYRSPSNEEITAQVTSCGWVTPNLTPGASECFYLMTRPLPSVPVDTILTRYVSAVSVAEPTKLDVAKTLTVVNSAYQPDLWLRTGVEPTTYTGNDIYNTTGVGQTKTQNVDIGHTAYYYCRVQNDGDAAEAFTVAGPANSGGWAVDYYQYASGAAITGAVTGAGWNTGPIDRC